ncbi:MAG: Potassium-transporting ATPase KdpC subunit [Phycisphaerae bacterium]|nr:Potassium-transporting ATPase KdpC subunit [Phycisphaerae bacterium]
MFRELIISIRALLVLTVLTGILYPLSMTLIAQVIFPHQANGSLVNRAGQNLSSPDGSQAGSALIGQAFDSPQYFWSRPSATAPLAYNAAASTGSNLAIGNPAQLEAVKQRITKLREADPGNNQPVPIDLITASASGLDPHISLAAAEYQVARVARVRGISEEQIRKLVRENTTPRQWGILGEPVVNVLRLNLALDKASSVEHSDGA